MTAGPPAAAPDLTHHPSGRAPAFLRLVGSPIWALNVCVAAAALVLYLGPVGDYSAVVDSYLPWWALALSFVVAERCVVHMQFRRSAHSFSLGDLPLVFGLLFASASDLVLGSLIGTALVLLFDRRLPAIKLVFNLAQFALGECLALLVLHTLISGQHESVGPLVWAGTFLATQTSAVIAVLLIGAAISLSEGWIKPKMLLQMLGLDAIITLTNTSVGLLGAMIVRTDARAIPLLVVPLITVFFAYRAYILERQRHERLEFLHETTRTLARAPEIVLALENLLERSLEAFRAEFAEIILFSSDGAGPLRTALGPGKHKEVMEPVDPELARDFLRLVTKTPAVRLERPFGTERLRQYLDGRRATDAMVALMPGEERVIGTIMLANRLGVVRSFTTDDLRLLETLANNASVALQYDRMEQAVLQLRELQEQLEHQAFHDPLTGLANRSLFVNQVRDALTGNDGVAVMFIDVDDFKTVNDSLGHGAGDELLVSVAERLKECVRPADTVARLGGDEFAVMVQDRQAVHETAVAITERVMQAFEQPMRVLDETVSTHVSIGIATNQQSSGRAEELIRDADVAMYHAKTAGKHRYQIFDPLMRSAVRRRHEMKEELRSAIERNELAIEYQPIFGLKTGVVVAAEALVRWKHPMRGPLPPGEFVPLAEETGLIVAVGEWVLKEACDQAGRWQGASSETPPSVHVNLSAVELRDPSLVERVEGCIASAGIEPSALVLEITETVLVEDADFSAATLEQLRHIGVRLALDDFGTGYSSLGYLRALPLDMLKIAMPFIEGLARERRENSFVRMILELASTLDLRVVAEGIESAHQLEVLRELGCELGQGFYLGYPASAAALAARRTSAESSEFPAKAASDLTSISPGLPAPGSLS
jgi:diguanylate cyclase (GGDEF)-like protein